MIALQRKSSALALSHLVRTSSTLSSSILSRPSLTANPPHRGISLFTNSQHLTEEQKLIQESAQEFSATELAPYAAEWDQKCHFPIDVIKKTAELGLAGIYVREEYGGTGLGRIQASLVFEALSQGCVTTSAYLSIHNMCSWMVDTFGTQEQREKWLPKMTTLEYFSSYCLTEPNSGSDAAAMKTTATKKGDYYILNGSKAFISVAHVSHLFLVMCKTGENEISCLAVERDTPGLSFGKPEVKLGWNSQPTGMVMFDDCKVPVSNVIGKVGDGFKIAMKGLDGGRINIASCSLGGASFALQETIKYMKGRKQFGKSLDKFQHLSFRMADMAIKLESSRLMVRHAARLMDQKSPDASMYAAMAKKHTTEECFDLVDNCLQMHGGYGYLRDYPIERVLRDIRVHRILEGTSEIMLLIIARNLFKD